MSKFAWIIARRFAKGFIAGGVSSMLIILQSTPLVLGDWQNSVNILITGFLTGGLLALEKMLQGYQE